MIYYFWTESGKNGKHEILLLVKENWVEIGSKFLNVKYI